MQCTIRPRRHLECNSLRHAEPMKADERVGDVVTTSQVENEPCVPVSATIMTRTHHHRFVYSLCRTKKLWSSVLGCTPQQVRIGHFDSNNIGLLIFPCDPRVKACMLELQQNTWLVVRRPACLGQLRVPWTAMVLCSLGGLHV